MRGQSRKGGCTTESLILARCLHHHKALFLSAFFTVSPSFPSLSIPCFCRESSQKALCTTWRRPCMLCGSPPQHPPPLPAPLLWALMVHRNRSSSPSQTLQLTPPSFLQGRENTVRMEASRLLQEERLLPAHPPCTAPLTSSSSRAGRGLQAERITCSASQTAMEGCISLACPAPPGQP